MHFTSTNEDDRLTNFGGWPPTQMWLSVLMGSVAVPIIIGAMLFMAPIKNRSRTRPTEADHGRARRAFLVNCLLTERPQDVVALSGRTWRD
jgi:hypothetical protein